MYKVKIKMNFFEQFNLQDFLTCFFALLAVIDALGASPIIIDLRHKGREVRAGKAVLISFALLLTFLFAGEWLLRLFSVDIKSFAIGGAIILFLLSLEMILDIDIFHNENCPSNSATLIPLVFPLLAGAAAFTTLLSFRSQFATINIVAALAANMLWAYIVLKCALRAERAFSGNMIYIIRKFFGIILLAVSIRLFTSNLLPLIHSLSQQ